MADEPARLQQALGDRYTIEGELGRGGMATVYRAHDLRHDRRIALKVLHPELAAALGSDRFLREIRIAAGLSHPHIVPLLDSGTSEGRCWFAMPLLDGESLRARLERGGPMPLAEAIGIAREVAEALHHAHGRGVVHRDVKPENIILTADGAFVTDFGIARRARDEDARLTTAGFALGTPTYMAPEQAVSDGGADPRSDVYALGCVLFEMLAGRPPYPGPGVVELLVQHAQAPIPSVAAHRPEVPGALDALLRAMLAKAPAGRPPTGQAVAEALEGIPAGPGRPGPVASRLRWTVGAAVGLVVAAAAAILGRRAPAGSAPGGDRAADVVAVVPFRVSGADPSLGYLSEGMVDLLAALLDGEVGLRAADPRSVLAALRREGPDPRTATLDEARRAARALGATRLLVGSVVGTPERVVLDATLMPLGAGRERRARVEGPVDSLSRLVEGLAGQVVALEAGEGEARLGQLAGTSPAALRAYLAGLTAYRAGRYGEAVGRFSAALATDSGFALAAIGLRLAAGWIGSSEVQRGTRLAWERRDRLGPRDLALVTALAGPSYPAYSSEADVLRAWERAAALAPDLPEAQYELGDQLYHAGALLGIPDAVARAEADFGRALRLDSTFSAPYGHLAELAARSGDSAAARRFGRLFALRDAGADVADFIAWRVAVAVGDAATLAALRTRMATMSPESLRRIVVAAQLDGVGLDDAGAALQHWLALHREPLERWFALLRAHDFWLNRGRPDLARAVSESLAVVRPASRAPLRLRIEDALFGGGDGGAALRAVAELERRFARPVRDAGEAEERLADACALGVWHAIESGGRLGRVWHERLRALPVPADRVETAAQHRWCDIAVGAILDPRLLPALDSVLLTGPRPAETSRSLLFRTFVWANPLAARLHEARGDLSAALAAARRRPYHGAGTVYLATALAAEARLAAATGDSTGAAAARRHRMALDGRSPTVAASFRFPVGHPDDGARPDAPLR